MNSKPDQKSPRAYTYSAYALSVIALLFSTTNSDAAESLPYQAGAPSVFLGLVPPFPGLYYLMQNEFFNGDALHGPTGAKLPVPFRLNGYADVNRFLGVWPVTLPGNGRLATQLIVPVIDLGVRAGPIGGSTGGLGGLVLSPYIASWDVAPSATVTTGLDVSFPVGAYKRGEISNLSNNYWSVQPVLALRYDHPDGLDLGISPRVAFNSTNHATSYHSGNALFVDFVAGWNFGNFKLDVVGGYTKQFENDRIDGVAPPGGNRVDSFAAGPSLSYQAGPILLNLNYQRTLRARNTASGDAVWLNAAIPISLLLSGGPPHP